MDKVFALQTRSSEFRSPNPGKCPVGMEATYDSSTRGLRQDVSRESWLARLATLTNSRFNKRTLSLSQLIKGGVIKEDTHCQPLAPMGRHTHM